MPKETIAPPDYPIIDAPDKAQQENIDGYFKKDNKKDDNKNDDVSIYYANTKTHKFHRPDCIYAKNLSDANARLEKDKEVLLLDGYSPCAKCNP